MRESCITALLLGCLGLLTSSVPAAAGEVGSPDAADTARFIDRWIDERLAAEGIPASPACSDSEFLRRLHLDLHGRIPTAEEARAFLDDASPDKWTRLIDERLAHEDYGAWFGDVWFRLLIPDRANKNKVKTEPFREWLAVQFNRNRPWNELARDLLTGTGEDVYDNPALTVFLNGSFTLAPEEVVDVVTPVFLGVKVECAQCHDHPFEEWTQDDFWGMAAFFTKVVRDGRGSGSTKGLTEGMGLNRRLKPPPYARVVPATFLDDERPELDPEGPYRPALADWITAPENPYFAKAVVNRVWAHFFGLGIVNPVDDMQESNAPSHPELLAGLTGRFVASGYDLKFLVRSITGSRAYQRSSRPVPGNETDTALYGRKPVRLLTSHELHDSLLTLGLVGGGTPAKTQQLRKRFAGFVQSGDDPLEYDRGIPQLLMLMNSNAYATSQFKRLQAIVEQQKTADEVVETLYLSILSRRPTADELRRVSTLVDETSDRTLAESGTDVFWVLLNSGEFSLR